jgi:hypothetical protein
MALAVVSAGVLYLFIPSEFRISTSASVAYPLVLAGLLGVLVLGDPGRIDRDVRWLVVTAVLLRR